MKSVIGITFLGSFLLLGACATNTPVVAKEPVNVTVMSETATKQLINDIRNATLTNIEKQVPNARPVTVVATLYVVYGGEAAFRNSSVYSGGSDMSHSSYWGVTTLGMAVPSTSATPWADGSTPIVGAYDYSGSNLISGPTRGPIAWMRVSYTIKDADGRVLESKEKWQPADRPRHAIEHIFPALYDSARVADTAAYLASRVAALSR
ncbi:MAG TPA: hypothetical protein VNN08_23780 [Thermoanaerobaculia bacterium]|nr:hypothetical protein [Thermoanaerobaculia bacterium]